jgi:hypothetical protein
MPQAAVQSVVAVAARERATSRVEKVPAAAYSGLVSQVLSGTAGGVSGCSVDGQIESKISE